MMAHESHHQQQKHGILMSSGFGYPDFSSSNNHPIQSFEPNHELFGLQAGMEMLGMPSIKQDQNPNFWRRYSESSSNDNLMVTPEITNQWQQSNRMVVDDSSLRWLFPCEGSEQPSQGLSLSLCNPKPSHIGLPQPDMRHQQEFLMQQQQPQQLIRSSKYLVPAQELLNEFCNLGGSRNTKHKSHKPNQWEEGGSSSSWNQSLHSLDLLELQKRKAKLLSMLEEVDRRYRKYCDQMRAVVSSFEGVAGEGSARVYSTLASKAMSRHFRCLRDGIVVQIKATKKAMGEKDPVAAAAGGTRGETPRLKLLDQCLRQQKVFQHSGMMENHPWRPQRGLPERSVSILRAWLFEHFLHPYPSDVDKHILARQTGLNRSQVSNWFINARVRLWKPMVEEMYMEETKEQDSQSSQAVVRHEDENTLPNQIHSNPNPNPNPNPKNPQLLLEDQKPTPVQLPNDSDSLSSIINIKNPHYQHHQHQFPRAENFGAVDLDFSSYDACRNQNFGNAVSLTLGLQQHNGGGMSLSFSPASQNSLFFREQIDNDCQPVQFSILDGEGQNLPYRNLMGAQLLHDLAG